MSADYKPSPDFVVQVMRQVHRYEEARFSWARWFGEHPLLRYALAGGGTLFGVFKAIPVF